MRGTRALVMTVALALGLAAGWRVAQRHLARHRADLFSPRRARRLAALGYLASQGTPATVRLLRDYTAWESVPWLRRRGERILRRMEHSLA